MRYYATIKTEQTYEIEAENPEEAERYFRAKINPGEPVTNYPDWATLEIEEV